MSRILIVSGDRAASRRIVEFARRCGLQVFLARHSEGAASFIGVIELDVVVVDEVNEQLLAAVKRNHPQATTVCIASRLDMQTVADFLLYKPVDLFVFERLLQRHPTLRVNPSEEETPDSETSREVVEDERIKA